MPHPLSINDVTNRCLASLGRCFKSGNDPDAVELMRSEVREIARDVAPWALSGEAKAKLILRPLEEVLVNYYGAHNGRRLYWDFLDAFWLQSWSAIPLAPPEPRSIRLDPPYECRAVG